MRAREKQNGGPQDVSHASLRERWRAGSPLVGFFTRLRDSAAYEILARTSTDFIIIDMEHGSFDRPLLAECLLAGRAHGLAMLVRVPDDNESTIQHAIGAGRVNMWPHRLWRAGGGVSRSS
jgi:2-keto-3-deoxy-L-rhamnonate aldolase RhmA